MTALESLRRAKIVPELSAQQLKSLERARNEAIGARVSIRSQTAHAGGRGGRGGAFYHTH